MAIYVSGFICQQIIRDEEGILTAFKIGDSVTLELPYGADPNHTVIIAQLPVSAFISFKSDKPDKLDVEVRVIDPAGNQRGHEIYNGLELGAGVQGQNLRLNLISLSVSVPGLWHVDVLVNGTLALWIPFQIKHKIPDAPRQGRHPIEPDLAPSE